MTPHRPRLHLRLSHESATVGHMNPSDEPGAIRATFRDRRVASLRVFDRRPSESLDLHASGLLRRGIGVQRIGHATASRNCTMVPREGRRHGRGLWKPECLAWAAGVAVMNRDDITELHYICPLETVPSILEHGILSHKAAARVPHQSIANEDVQARRAQVKIPGGQKLHSYVNLYFNGRNPMMYTVCKTEDMDSICLLQVKPDVMDVSGVVITDRNASSSAVRFAEPDSGLARLDADVVFAQYWTHTDYIKQHDHKSRMCAEVLVPSIVHPEMITGAYVASKNARRALRQLAPGFSVSVDKYKFFRQG